MAIPKDTSYPRVLAAVETAKQARIAATNRLNLKNCLPLKPDFNPNESSSIDDFYMHESNTTLIKLEEDVDYKVLPSCNDDSFVVEIEGAVHYLKHGWAI